MTKTSTTTRTLLMCGAAALSLGLGACKDKSAASAGGEAVSAIDIAGMSDRDIKARFDVAPRKVDTASAEAALAEIRLLEESDNVSWGSREGADGTYTYTDLVIENEDSGARIGIARLDVVGAHMEGEDARFDKIVLDDLEASDPEDSVTASLDAMTLVNPRVESVAFLSESADTDELPSADALALEGLSFRAKDDDADITFGLSNVAYAAQTAAGAKDGFFTLSDMTMDGTAMESGAQIPLDMSLGGITITDMSSLEEIQGLGMAGSTGLGNAVSNPYNLPFKQFSLDDLDVMVDGFSMDVDSIAMTSDQKGQVLSVRSAMKPMTFKFASDPASPQLASFRDAVSKLGYDEIVLTAEGNSVIDLDADTAVSRDGHFTMRDGFRMEIDQDMRGVAAMQNAQTEALRAAGFDTPPGADATPEEQQAFAAAAMEGTMNGVAALELGEFVLSIDDNSIMERIFEMMAQADDTSAKMKRAEAKSMLALGSMAGAGTGVDGDIITAAVAALGEWIDNPGSTLVLGIDPEGYVPVTQVPTLDAQALGFVARVDK